MPRPRRPVRLPAPLPAAAAGAGQVAPPPSLSLSLALGRRPALRRFLAGAVAAVEGAGGEPYLAGGFVRDLLLGREGKDVDLVLTGIPTPLLSTLVAGWEGTLPGVRKVVRAGRHFPVHKVRIDGEEEYVDVAAPMGAGGTGEEAVRADGGRRDFTVNAVFLRLRLRGRTLSGEVADHHGGVEDIGRRRLRTVGSPEDRFREDPARILRLVRLAAILEGFRPDAVTCAEARRLAPELLPSLPGERISGELLKALAASPGRGCSLLLRLGILPLLLPPLAGREREAARTLSRRLSLLAARGGAGEAHRPLLPASLLLLLPPEERERWGRSLALPELRPALRLCADAEAFLHPADGEPCPLAAAERILLRRGDAATLVLLLRTLGEAGRRGAGAVERVARLSRLRPPLVTGRDLSRLAVPPGEAAGRLLLAVREEELRGALRNREEALHRAGELAGGTVRKGVDWRRKGTGGSTGGDPWA